MEQGVLTALGLSAPAGLNAYLTLLLVALADRFTAFDLGPNYDWLSSTPALLVLTGLLAVEEVVDKIPGADHVNDVIGTVVRPASGGWLAAASGEGTIDPVAAAAIGGILAGSVHGAKASARPFVTLGTAGMGNWLVSLLEDGVAVVAVVIALVVPVLVVLTLLVFAAAVAWVVARRIRRHRPST